MTAGIYAIINSMKNRIYIGSSGDVENRLKKHLNQLKRKTHYNKILQKDYNEFPNNIFFRVVFEIREVTPNGLLQKEQYFMDLINDEGKKELYNIACAKSENPSKYNSIYISDSLEKRMKAFKKTKSKQFNVSLSYPECLEFLLNEYERNNKPEFVLPGSG